jgi:hypothetical protein
MLMHIGSRLDEAEPLPREAIATRESSYGKWDERAAEARLAPGECVLAKGRDGYALPRLDASYEALRARHADAVTWRCT